MLGASQVAQERNLDVLKLNLDALGLNVDTLGSLKPSKNLEKPKEKQCFLLLVDLRF